MTTRLAVTRRNVVRKPVSLDDLSLGMMVRMQRMCRGQTPQDIADIAGLSRKDVELFENNQPLRPAIKRKLLRAYDLIVETDLEKLSL